jgi:hypothetical protein
MRTIYQAVLAMAITAAATPGALAAVSTADAVGACKEQAGIEFTQEGVNTRIKFRGSSRKDGATEVRLQVYPQGSDSFKANCMLDRKTGELLSLAREGAAAANLVQTAER